MQPPLNKIISWNLPICSQNCYFKLQTHKRQKKSSSSDPKVTLESSISYFLRDYFEARPKGYTDYHTIWDFNKYKSSLEYS